MFSLLPGLALVVFGMLCHRRGLRRAAFASERAEYLPANIIVQAAALCWVVPVLPASHSLLLVTGQLIGVTLMASGYRLPRVAADWRQCAPDKRDNGHALRPTPAWQTARVRTDS